MRLLPQAKARCAQRLALFLPGCRGLPHTRCPLPLPPPLPTPHAAADLVIGYMGVPYRGGDMTSHPQYLTVRNERGRELLDSGERAGCPLGAAGGRSEGRAGQGRGEVSVTAAK